MGGSERERDAGAARGAADAVSNPGVAASATSSLLAPCAQWAVAAAIGRGGRRLCTALGSLAIGLLETSGSTTGAGLPCESLAPVMPDSKSSDPSWLLILLASGAGSAYTGDLNEELDDARSPPRGLPARAPAEEARPG